MLNANVESAGSKGANGFDILTMTLPGPIALTDVTGESKNPHGLFGLRSRLIEVTTSVEVSGEPSENFTPCLRSKIAWRPFLEIVQLVASSGETLLPLF